MRLVCSLFLPLLLLSFVGCGSGTLNSTAAAPGGLGNSVGSAPGSDGNASHATSFVYAVPGTTVEGFKVDASGTFTPIANLNSGSNLLLNHISASPDGRLLYTVEKQCFPVCPYDYMNRLLVQTIGPDGSLSQPVQALGEDQLPYQVRISSDSKWAFVASGIGTFSIRRIADDGTLEPAPASVQTSYFGQYGYNIVQIADVSQNLPIVWLKLINQDRNYYQATVMALTYDPQTGAITGRASQALPEGAELEAVGASGNTAIVEGGTYFTSSGSAGSMLHTYSLDHGALNELNVCNGWQDQTCAGATNIVTHAALPVFYTLRFGVAVRAMNLNPDGSVTPNGDFLSYSGASLATDTQSTRLFVGRNDGGITALSIDQSTGALSEIGTAHASTRVGALVAVTR